MGEQEATYYHGYYHYCENYSVEEVKAVGLIKFLVLDFGYQIDYVATNPNNSREENDREYANRQKFVKDVFNVLEKEEGAREKQDKHSYNFDKYNLLVGKQSFFWIKPLVAVVF